MEYLAQDELNRIAQFYIKTEIKKLVTERVVKSKTISDF